MIEMCNIVTPGSTENSVMIVQVIELTANHSKKYMKLDAFLRKLADNSKVQDAMSDLGWSYSNDILGTRNWDSLDVLISDIEKLIGEKICE